MRRGVVQLGRQSDGRKRGANRTGPCGDVTQRTALVPQIHRRNCSRLIPCHYVSPYLTPND